MTAERDEAYILHRRAFKETSMLLECFTRQHGWISLMARGAKRARSRFEARLQSFIPLEIEWGGRGELKTLFKAEAQRFSPPLTQEKLMVGLYLNELLVRLLQRGDPHLALYDCYQETLVKIALLSHNDGLQPLLRQFEIKLLAELGYGLELDQDAKGRPVQPELLYTYDPKIGICEIPPGSFFVSCVVSGAALLGLKNNHYASEALLGEAKRMMRYILEKYLGEKPLETRQLYLR